MSRSGPAAVVPTTLEQLEAFYIAHYSPMVKFLVILGATVEEAEDAVQKAMADLIRRSRTAEPLRHPVAWVQQAAVRFFIKERQRDRKRLPLTLQGGHLVDEAHVDGRLTDWEDSQYIEHLLGRLTLVQCQVIKRVMAGLTTPQIAEELGKKDENIRQQLKNGRDRLKSHPEIALLASRESPGVSPAKQEGRSTVTMPEPRKEEIQ